MKISDISAHHCIGPMGRPPHSRIKRTVRERHRKITTTTVGCPTHLLSFWGFYRVFPSNLPNQVKGSTGLEDFQGVFQGFLVTPYCGWWQNPYKTQHRTQKPIQNIGESYVQNYSATRFCKARGRWSWLSNHPKNSMIIPWVLQ